MTNVSIDCDKTAAILRTLWSSVVPLPIFTLPKDLIPANALVPPLIPSPSERLVVGWVKFNQHYRLIDSKITQPRENLFEPLVLVS